MSDFNFWWQINLSSSFSDLPQPPVVEDGNNPASAAVDLPNAPEDINHVTFQNRYHQLQDKELDNGSLSVDEYTELFLAEVVQNLNCVNLIN